jgi:hypothetical protein
VAFLILTHRGPEQLARLVGRLLAPGTSVHVHIDRKTSAAVHAAMVRALPADERVHLLERLPTPWASWTYVEATLRGIETIIGAPAPPEHVVLLSGQDYPLRPAREIAAFLAQYRGWTFSASWPMPAPHYDRDGGMYRIRHWHRPVRGRRLRVPIARRYPSGIRPFGGSAWMILDRETASAALRFTRERPDVVRFHRHVWAVDEHYLQTAIHNSPRANAVIDEHLWHLEWPPGGSHPRTFTESDFDRLADAARHSSDAGGRARAKLFARKFDAERDARVLDRIDAELLG